MTKDKIKKHINDHLVLYSVGLTVVVAGITCVIMRGHYAELRGGSDEGLILNKLFVRPLSIFSEGQTTNIIAVAEREGRGHPGYIVRSLDTGEVFTSQHKAAKAFDIPASVLSDHLRGNFDHANGHRFERIGLI